MASRTAEFRPGQWEAINALVNRRERLLVVQRTGWGKSSVYFIATRILRDRGRGPTLIVSPLLALMRNQIEAAGRLGIRALSINSTNRQQWPGLRRAVLDGEADALLISPERLANDDFVEDVLLPIAGSIGLLVVDEAHYPEPRWRVRNRGAGAERSRAAGRRRRGLRMDVDRHCRAASASRQRVGVAVSSGNFVLGDLRCTRTPGLRRPCS